MSRGGNIQRVAHLQNQNYLVAERLNMWFKMNEFEYVIFYQTIDIYHTKMTLMDVAREIFQLPKYLVYPLVVTNTTIDTPCCSYIIHIGLSRKYLQAHCTNIMAYWISL